MIIKIELQQVIFKEMQALTTLCAKEVFYKAPDSSADFLQFQGQHAWAHIS